MRAVIYLSFALSDGVRRPQSPGAPAVSPRLAAWSVTVAMVLLAGSTIAALALLAWPLVGLVAGLALVGMAIVWATRDTEHLFEHLQRH